MKVLLLILCLLLVGCYAGDDDDVQAGAQGDDDNDSGDDDDTVDDDNDDNDDNDTVDDDDNDDIADDDTADDDNDNDDTGDDDDDDDNDDDDDDDDNDDDDDDDNDDDTTIPGTYVDGERMWQTEDGPDMLYPDAPMYCMNLTVGGFTDWVLPDIDDLRSLIRNSWPTVEGGSCGVTDTCQASSCRDATCNRHGYEGTGPAGGCFWPSEMGDGACHVDSYGFGSDSWVWDMPDVLWTVFFSSGGIVSMDSNVTRVYVRCVRRL